MTNAYSWGRSHRGQIASFIFACSILGLTNIWYACTQIHDINNPAYTDRVNDSIDTAVDVEHTITSTANITTEEPTLVSQEETSVDIVPVPAPASIHNSDSNANAPFERYDGVVIVTKVLWPKDIQHLKNWICLINHAYNDKVKYDVVVFTTMPWDDKDIAQLQKAALPAKLTVALEAPPLEEQMAAMTKEEVQFLNDRCGHKANETLTWNHYCTEPGSKHKTNLGYSWQAEFRAYHIWTHPAIKEYKYMMWLDTDAMVGKNWDVDPMKVMIENDLTVMYAGYPYGTIRSNITLGGKLMQAYNTSICDVGKDKRSQIHAKVCKDEPATVQQIAGMHHITNLHVFRKDVHQKFLKAFTGDYRFSRKSDDQVAVTIVGLMEQYIQNNYTDGVPKKYTVWHQRSNNMTMKISHHKMYDCSPPEKAIRNNPKFFNHVKGNWTGLEERCGAIIRNE
jgi:hypothetical protein